MKKEDKVEILEIYGRNGNVKLALPKNGDPIVIQHSGESWIFDGQSVLQYWNGGVDEWKDKKQELKEYLERAI